MNTDDSDECERSFQTRRTGMLSGESSVTEAGAEVGDGQERVMRNHLVFLIFKNIKLL